MAAVPQDRMLIDSDEVLAARVGRGDTVAFEELYRRYARPLAAFGARLLRDRAAGEDVAQTSLMNAYRSMRRGTRPLHLRPWLYRIARNAAYEAHQRRQGEVVDSDLVDSPTPPDESGFDRELWYDGVRGLPSRQRNAYLLREVNGLSVPEIGDRLGLTRPQVDQAIFAARNTLAERLTFGGTVDCESLQAAARASALPPSRNRALKAHLRACEKCRDGLLTRPVGIISNLGMGLRQLLQWLTTGGAAPVAAKVGALVAAAAVTAAASPHLYRAAAAAVDLTGIAHSAPATPAGRSAATSRQTSISRTGLVFMSLSSATHPFGSAGGGVGGPPPVFAVDPTPTTGSATTTPTVADDSDEATIDPGASDGDQADASSDDSSEASSDPASSDSTDPSATDPSVTDPTVTDPTVTDPTATDPSATDPTATDPSATDPTATDPTTTTTGP